MAEKTLSWLLYGGSVFGVIQVAVDEADRWQWFAITLVLLATAQIVLNERKDDDG